MPYVCYLRKSRQDLELEAATGADTLARHRAQLKELAARLGLTIDATYEEIVSGETIDARPMMQRLLREVEQNLWTGVLVVEIERLARGDSIDQGIVARAFKYSETLIITPNKIYDPTKEMDEEYMEFGLFMSRREFQTIRRRLTRGVQAARKEGKYTAGQPPLGYTKIKLPHEKGGTLQINPETAPLARDIFNWYTEERLTISEITHRLNTLQPPPTGKANRWYNKRVSLLLRNPHYAGYTTSSRRPTTNTIVDGKIKKIRTNLPLAKVQLYQGRHEALISIEQWEKAQSLLKQNFTPPVPRGKGQKNALVGLIRCGGCGRIMQRSTNSSGVAHSRNEIIFCLTRDKSVCPMISHNYTEIEQMVLSTLRKWLEDYTLADLPDPNQSLRDSLSAQIKAAEKTISTLNSRIARAFELVETGVYTPALFAERKAELDTQLGKTTVQLSQLHQQLAELSDANIIQTVFVPQLTHVLESYSTCENALEKNRLLKTVIKEIIYTKTERITPNSAGNLHLEIFPLLPHPKH